MRSSLLFLVLTVASTKTSPLQDTLNTRLFLRNKDAASAATEIEMVAGTDATNRPAKKQSEKTDGGMKDSKPSLPTSISIQDNRAESKPDSPQSQKGGNESRDKVVKRNRKHKSFANYQSVPQLPFSNAPYDINYKGSSNFDAKGRKVADQNRYEESNIFYIRLPPTPYMFVPGLGYISQPPTYSTSALRPQIFYPRPSRPKPVYQQPVNPFIKLPIDFVSNGKPTSVYQWQKKNKKPTDSPITNLDNLSPDFVSNGKPTSIYQWQTNLKPIKKPGDLVNNLDKGPYSFNGKPTSFFLLKADGTSTAHQPLRYPDYQQDNSYY